MNLSVAALAVGFLLVIAPSGAQDEEEEVKALNCYVCKSDNSTDCRAISKDQKTYLEKCLNGKCYVKEERDKSILGNVILTRGCSLEPDTVVCALKITTPVCCECSTDGCNSDNVCRVGSAAPSFGISNLACTLSVIFLAIYVCM